MDPDAITRYVHTHIPITQHIGITVLAVEDFAIWLSAPYAPNINHRETIFGGSISTLGILSGWALLWAKLQTQALPNRLVIQSSQTNFVQPATDAITACCDTLDSFRWTTFCAMLERRGKARLELQATICCHETVVATHVGQYVAIKL